MSKKPTERPPTMADVARLAGVSQTTVSFVMNDAPSAATIPKETQERVRAAISRLGYRPNAAAKLLRTSASHTIGFISDHVAATPFAGAMIAAAQRRAWEQGKVLIIVNTGGDPAVDDAAVEMMLERRVEGIIYAADHHRQVSPPAGMAEVPAVLLDCYAADRSLPSVVPDEEGGGWTATELLLRKGHRRIGFLNVRPTIPAAVGRLAGYRRALAAHGIAYDAALVRSTLDSTADEGYDHVRDLLLLTKPPTAIFCGTDRLAMGAYDAIKERGYLIPRDIAVVGFDDQQVISRYLRPALSTVALPHAAMGEWAVRYLIESQDASFDGLPIQHSVPCPLVERASV